MGFKETGQEDVERIHAAHDRGPVAGSCSRLFSQELYCMELISLQILQPISSTYFTYIPSFWNCKLPNVMVEWLKFLLRIREVKSKAVPLQAMEALGRREDIAPTHSRPRH
jgi:hypothetical protein